MGIILNKMFVLLQAANDTVIGGAVQDVSGESELISKVVPLSEGDKWMNKIYNREDGLAKIVFLCDESER